MTASAFGNRISDSAIRETLKDIALDLRWSYNHSADEIWERLDPDLWGTTHNPWVVLQTASPEKLQKVAADPAFQKCLAQAHKEKTEAESGAAWFQKTHPKAALTCVAYLSMEFMLSEALPIYSGGLGNVAGDQLKTASNLGVPVIGVSLLYQQGYFRQEIDGQGHQQALYPFNDPGQLPIQPVRDTNGEWLRLALDFPGSKVWIRVWQAQVGRTRLILLDTNDPANLPAHRGIASELYGGGPELRLKQEIVLGIGGWRVLRAMGLQPQVCHLNEGHAAFAVLERACSYMAEAKAGFDQALTTTRAGNLFTTHTPVDAGFDRFDQALMDRYLRNYAEKSLSISLSDLMALGRRNRDDFAESFNMAYLAIRGSGAVNGVSKLHGQVSRQLFQNLFPRWPEREVPVSYVTNGVHAPTWDSAEADELWETACGKERWREDLEGVEDDLRQVSDAALWQLRTKSRKSLVAYVRQRHATQIASRGGSLDQIAQARQILNENALTLGFARRFAPYKRPNLLLHDSEKLVRILTNKDRPVQLVLAGKAHPADGAGQDMIRQWIEFAQRPEVRRNVVFLSDYDLLMAEHLVQGADLWLNTPRRPWEASGTSGMKVLVNGGLNLSELDGWWAEAYSPEVGWAIGDGREHHGDPGWDAIEAGSLYDLLEREIIPEFYSRGADGIPHNWAKKMRESMCCLTPRFSANRVVRQYTEGHYLPAAAAYAERTAKNGAAGAEIQRWKLEVAARWASARFGKAFMERKEERKDGQYFFRVEVFLGGLRPEDVSVQLYAEPQDGDAPTIVTMSAVESFGEGGLAFLATVPASRPAADFTPRVVAHHQGAFVPIEASQILWHDSPSWR